MIRIQVYAGTDLHTRIDELYDAVRDEARVWKMKDLRKTKNLTLTHTYGRVKGIVRRVSTKSKEFLEFECKSKQPADEAITAGRFVNLVLRYLEDVTEIRITP